MKTTVEIEWDEPQIQAWLCADNISIALHSYCTNTKFKVKEVSLLDAFKAGMTHAAGIASPMNCWPDCGSEFCEGREDASERILKSRDTMTALPEVKP